MGGLVTDDDVCELHGHLWADGVCRRCPETQPTPQSRIDAIRELLKEKGTDT
jgi:hypothetical protein